MSTIWDEAEAEGFDWKPSAAEAHVTPEKALAAAADLPDAFKPPPMGDVRYR
jgi:hypothetical protein